jgi:hypothetical protein
VERGDVVEPVLVLFGGRDRAELGHDPHLDPSTIEGRERVLQADAELPDNLARVGELLLVLVLGQVFIADAAAEVVDMPRLVRILRDGRFGSRGE